MSQIVTETETEAICERLNEALVAARYKRVNFSNESQLLLQQAWAVASHKRNTQVTIYHLAYALVFYGAESGIALAEHLETDVDEFAVGCILLISSLGVAASPPDGEEFVLWPAIGAIRWVGEAGDLAKMRVQGSEVQPADLAEVLLKGILPPYERAMFRKAARVGEARYGTVIGSRPVKTIAESRSTDIIEHLEEVEKGADSTLLISLTEFEERYSSDIEAQKLAFTSASERLANIEERVLLLSDVSRRLDAIDASATVTASRLTAIEKQVQLIDDVPRRLGAIDNDVVMIEKSLPRPLSGIRLSAAIIVVLAIGLLTGLWLTKLQSNGHNLSNVASSAR